MKYQGMTKQQLIEELINKENELTKLKQENILLKQNRQWEELLSKSISDITHAEENEYNLIKFDEQLAMYIKENEKLMFELRRFRHNTLNILYGLNGFIETKNWDGLKNYFSEIQEQVKVIKDNNPFSIEKIKNLPVRGLLTAKLVAAQKSNIAMHVEVDSDIKLDGKFMKDIDLCEVLGIYLDNAIEAAGQAANKRVSICAFEDNECISIIIENTYKDMPDLSRNKANRLTNGMERGLGLKLSEKIIGQYENVLHNTFVYQQIVIQELHILKR